MPSPPVPTVDEDSLRCPAALAAARRGGTDLDRYVAPTDAERDALRDTIATLTKMGAQARGPASRSAAHAGFEVIDLPEIPNAVLVREIEARRRGGGAYVVRFEARARDVAIEAPHTFFDEGTLPLACELFQRTNGAALFINTAHRYKASPADEHGDHPSDVAHNGSSLFQAATEGLIQSIPAATVVQLHGFAARGTDTTVVVSAGEKRQGDALVTRAAAALAKVLTGVKKYPEDSGELGATTNVQGQIVRAAGGRFLHVEMEAGVRRQLLNDPSLRASMLDAIGTVLQERPQ
jgi:hypothetical protein